MVSTLEGIIRRAHHVDPSARSRVVPTCKANPLLLSSPAAGMTVFIAGSISLSSSGVVGSLHVLDVVEVPFGERGSIDR